MVVLNEIYTRTGDAGETALGNGTRVAKHSARVTAYGTVDETNATVGLARLHATGEMDARLAAIQNDLFDLGADLCRPDMEKDTEAEYPPLRITAAQVDRLESEIDGMNEDRFGRKLGRDLIFGAAENERAESCAEKLATFLVVFFLDGGLVVASKAFERSQETGHEEAEERPELAEVVFHRSSGEAEAML